MTNVEVTREYVQTGLREEIDLFTHQVLAKVTKDTSQFHRKNRISSIKASELISIEMDDVLTQIDEDPPNSASAIEHLAYLYFARMVASRIESGAVLGSRSEAMKEKPKKARTKKAAKDAQELATAPVPAVAETEVVPAPVTEVLESDQDFLAQLDELTPADTTADLPTETPEDEPVELTRADNGVLDLL